MFFIAKYDKDGTFQWVRTKGGSSTDVGHEVRADDDGNIYLTGKYISIFSHTFITKYNKDGDVLWNEDLLGSGSDNSPMDIEKDESMNLYVTGWYTQPMNIDTITLTEPGDFNAYVAKLDSSHCCPKSIFPPELLRIN